MIKGKHSPFLLAGLKLDKRQVLNDISIVIPTLGRDLLERCLHSIVSGHAWPAEIIVVDQGRKPSVSSLMQELSALGLKTKYLPSSQRGRASGINRGIECVDNPFVVITDDDCLAHVHWLENMAKQLRRHPESIITGRVEAADSEENVALMTLSEPRTYHRPLLMYDPLCGGNMGVATEVINKIGLFDEDPRIHVAEDCELSYRALRSGVSIRYAPEVLVFHIGWRDENERISQYRAYARSHGSFYGKYLRKGDLFIALRIFIHLSRDCKRWVKGIVFSQPEHARRGSMYLKGLIPGIVNGMRKEVSG